MTILTPEQRQAIERAGTTPARLVDPETNTEYVLLKADLYEGLRALVEPEDDDRVVREMFPRIAAVFGPEGWDDPAMDVYNDLDPRRKP